MKKYLSIGLLLLTSCIGIGRCNDEDIYMWQIQECLNVCEKHDGLSHIDIRMQPNDLCECRDGNWEPMPQYRSQEKTR